MSETIKVKVTEVYFPKPGIDGDWFVFSTDKGTVKGKMPWRPGVGEMLRLEGTWGVYKGSPVFAFKSAIADIPVSEYDKLRYICEKTKGFGASIMNKIWEKWGESWKTDVESEVIPTLKGKKFDLLIESINDLETKQAEVECIAWLMSKSATTNLAQLAWKTWESNTVGIVNENCYRLSDLPNYGFNDVDEKVRVNFGINDTDTRRIEAAVVYSLKKLSGHGSTAVSWNSLRANAVGLVGSHNHELVVSAVNSLFGSGTLVGFRQSMNVSLKSDYENARTILAFINKIA